MVTQTDQQDHDESCLGFVFMKTYLSMLGFKIIKYQNLEGTIYLRTPLMI